MLGWTHFSMCLGSVAPKRFLALMVWLPLTNELLPVLEVSHTYQKTAVEIQGLDAPLWPVDPVLN